MAGAGALRSGCCRGAPGEAGDQAQAIRHGTPDRAAAQLLGAAAADDPPRRHAGRARPEGRHDVAGARAGTGARPTSSPSGSCRLSSGSRRCRCSRSRRRSATSAGRYVHPARQVLLRAIGIGGAREAGRAAVVGVGPRAGASATWSRTWSPDDADRATARRAALDSGAWQPRVLAGWLPPSGAPLARFVAAPAEIAASRTIARGWSRRAQRDLRLPRSPSVARHRLAARGGHVDSSRAPRAAGPVGLGGLGGTSEAELALALRLPSPRGPQQGGAFARPWAAGAAAVVVGREKLVFRRSVNAATARRADLLLGSGCATGSAR